jgi:hypothetical protein
MAGIPCRTFQEDWKTLKKGCVIVGFDEAIEAAYVGNETFGAVAYSLDRAEKLNPSISGRFMRLLGCKTTVIIRTEGAAE